MALAEMDNGDERKIENTDDLAVISTVQISLTIRLRVFLANEAVPSHPGRQQTKVTTLEAGPPTP